MSRLESLLQASESRLLRTNTFSPSEYEDENTKSIRNLMTARAVLNGLPVEGKEESGKRKAKNESVYEDDMA